MIAHICFFHAYSKYSKKGFKGIFRLSEHKSPISHSQIYPHKIYTCIYPTFDPGQPGRSIIDLIHNKAQVTVPFPEPLHHINRQDIQVLLSIATRPEQIESINNWISGICKDYLGIIPPEAMVPEHPDPEAVTLRMRQPGIKGIKLHGHRASLCPGHQGRCSNIYYFT